jgi:Mn-dependent DtxR family transcriptional regulator
MSSQEDTMTTAYEHEVLIDALAAHGPLTFSEAALATGGDWKVANEAIAVLRRHGYVVVLADDRVRLTTLGRRNSEARRG